MNSFEISLYGNIGDSMFVEGNGSKSVIDQIKLAAASGSPIDLHINSPGGSVFEGYTIYNALLAHRPGVTVYIDGLAASIAAYVAMAGAPIKMAQNAMLMIHNPTSASEGDAGKMRKQADLLDKVTQSYAKAFVDRSALTQEQVSSMMNEETWFTADEALLAGLVDEITPEMKMAASFDLSKFKHAPPILAHFDSIKTSMSDESPPAETSLVEKLKALVKPRAEMQAEITGLKTAIEVRDASIAQLNAKLNELAGENENYKVQLAEIPSLKNLVTELEKEAKTVEAAAIDKVAALGFPADKLPKQKDPDAKDENKAPDSKDLLEQINAIADPMEQTKFFREHEKEIKAALFAARPQLTKKQ